PWRDPPGPRRRPLLHLTQRGHERPGGAPSAPAGNHARPSAPGRSGRLEGEELSPAATSAERVDSGRAGSGPFRRRVEGVTHAADGDEVARGAGILLDLPAQAVDELL